MHFNPPLIRILLLGSGQPADASLVQGLQSAGYAIEKRKASIATLTGLKVNDYDSVIIDLQRSSLSVVDILRHIRSGNEIIPVIILADLQPLETKLLYFELGIDDWLIKPFALAELLARLKALLRRGHGLEKETLHISGLNLNRFSHRVTWYDKEIRLTHKEFLLLECLMRHPDKIISRKTIVEQVWEQKMQVTSNSVDVYIRQLRKKIDDKFKQKLIRTVRGAGYSIADEAVARSNADVMN